MSAVDRVELWMGVALAVLLALASFIAGRLDAVDRDRDRAPSIYIYPANAPEPDP